MSRLHAYVRWSETREGIEPPLYIEDVSDLLAENEMQAGTIAARDIQITELLGAASGCPHAWENWVVVDGVAKCSLCSVRDSSKHLHRLTVDRLSVENAALRDQREQR